MNIRRCIAIFSLLLALAGAWTAGCHNDQQIIDKHQQALEDDE